MTTRINGRDSGLEVPWDCELGAADSAEVVVGGDKQRVLGELLQLAALYAEQRGAALLDLRTAHPCTHKTITTKQTK